MKVLIEKTASSLDDTALKTLFVSVQRNNIEICIKFAVDLYVNVLVLLMRFDYDLFRVINVIGVISAVCPCHCLNDCKAEFDSGENDTIYIDMVWAFICE